MINLLPPDLRETYHFGKRNRALAHWLVVMVLCMAGAVALAGGGYLYLNRTINNTSSQLADSQRQLHQLNEGAVQKQITDVSNNLKLATQVLSKEILFSKLLKQLGAVTPNNAILTGLSITQVQGGVDITAQTTNYAAATQLQVNLADPNNKIFSQADIESIDCGGNGTTGGVNAQYPCAVTIRALFAKNNPYLFINNSSGASS